MPLSLHFSAVSRLDDLAKVVSVAALDSFKMREKSGAFDTKKGGLLIHPDAKKSEAVRIFAEADKTGGEEIQHLAAQALRSVAATFAGQKKLSIAVSVAPELKSHKMSIEKGVLLAAAAFDETLFKSEKAKKEQQQIEITGIADAKLKTITESIQLARELTSIPANILTTDALLDRIKKIAKSSPELKVKILRKKELQKEKMNLLLAVGAASPDEPALAVLEYTPKGTEKDKPVILIGKGLIYDSGGYGIKPGDYMADMYCDMGGAATVISVISALARLKTKRRVVAICGITENMISPNAMKTGDIITSKKGLTVEVLHTDAEGRLVLADCLAYAQEKYKPELIFDYATLTGAIVFALGEMYTGLYSQSDDLAEKFSTIGRETNDWNWRFPLDKLILDSVKGDRSDIINLSKLTRMLGHSTAAAFLQQFVDEPTHWVHFDIAGTAMRRSMRRGYDYTGLFGSGGMVHATIEFLTRK